MVLSASDLSYFPLVFGGNISEIVEELRYFSFFTQVFDTKIFQFFGFGGREGFDFFSQSVYFFYHVLTKFLFQVQI